MANSSDFLNIRNFTSEAVDANFGDLPTSSLTDQKAQSVAAKRADVARLLDSNFVRRASVATQNNNDMAQQELVQDMNTLTPTQFEVKYGSEAAALRAGYAQDYMSVDRLKDKQRSGGEVAKDALLDTGNMLGQTVLGIGQLGALPVDWALGTKIGNTLADTSEALNALSQEAGSDIRRDRNNLHQLEAQLNLEDNLAQRDKDIEDGESWLKANSKMVGRGFIDTVMNYADDPIMLGSLVPEMVGTMIPSTVAIRVAGKAAALSKIMKAKGLTRAAAAKYLTTEAGKAFLAKETTAVVPLVIGLTEAGTGINEAQGQILNMTEEELSVSPHYQKLIAEGMSPEDAKQRLALEASSVAGATGFTVGIVTGRIGRDFEVNPFKANRASGYGMVAPTGNLLIGVGKEGVEETLQEGVGAKFGSNLGQAAVGLSSDILAGVGEAGAEGALGGMLSSAAMGAPGAAVDTAANTSLTAAAGAYYAGKAAINAAGEAVSKRADAKDKASAVGTTATRDAVQTIGSAVEAITQEIAAPSPAETGAETTPETSAEDVNRAELVTALNDALVIEGADGSRQTVSALFEALDQVEGLSKITSSDAINLVNLFAGVQNLTSETVKAKVDALPEGDPIKTAYASAFEQKDTIESSTVLAKAKDTIANMSKEEIAKTLPLEKLTNGTASSEEKAAITNTVIAVARINPTALALDEYNIVLNQLDLGEKAKKPLMASRDLVQTLQETESRKTEITSRFDDVIEGLPDKARAAELKARRRTVADVRLDIQSRGNTKSVKGQASLAQYVARVNQLMSEGKVTKAKELMSQLGNFSQSQLNKMNSLNLAVKEGATGKQYLYEAYNGAEFFTQEETPVYVNKNSANSLIFALDVHADTQEVVQTYEALRKAYADEFADLEQKAVPDLDVRVDEYLENFPKAAAEKAAQVGESVSKSQTDSEQTTPAEEAPVAPETNTEMPRVSVKDRFVNLVTGASANKFLENFTRKAKSNDLLDIENLNEALIERAKADGMTAEGLAAFEALVSRVLPVLRKALLKHMELSESRLKSMLEKENGRDYANLRVTELYSQDPKSGKYRLDPVIADAAVMAAVEWLARLAGRPYAAPKAGELYKLFNGMTPNQVVSAEMKAAGSFGGVHLQAALDELMVDLQDMLGVSADKSVSPDVIQGIFGGLAANIIATLEDANMVERDSFTVEGKGKNFKRYALRAAPNSEQTLYVRKAVSRLNMPFSRLLNSAEDRKIFHIGEAPKTTASTQKRNKFSSLTTMMQKALKTQNNIAHRMNVPLVQMLDVLGSDTLKALLGYEELDPANTHPDILRSQEGKNNTVLSSIQSYEDMRAALEEYAAINEISVEEAEIFFENSVGSNGRMNQTANGSTPQSDKLLRELFVPSETEVSLESSEDMAAYWSGIAQAFDVSIEKKSDFGTIRQEAQEALAPFQPAVDLLKTLALKGTLSKADASKLTTQLKRAKDVLPGKALMKGFHALHAEALRQIAVENGDKTFSSRLTIEADGKTDGPVNAIMNLMTPFKGISNTLLQIMASGGYLIGSEKTSLDSYYSQKLPDLYGMVADRVGSAVIDKDDAKMTLALDIATAFLDGVDTGTDGGYVIDREVVKNPLTIFLYNSSEKGIADNLAELAAKNVYALMNDLRATQTKQAKSKRKNAKLRNTKVFKENSEALQLFMRMKDPRFANKAISAEMIEQFYTNPENLTVNEAGLSKLFEETLVTELVTTIDQLLPGLKDNMVLLQTVAQAQTALFQDVFAAETKKLLNGEDRGLSQAELEDAFVAAMKVAPIFYTPTQSLEITKLSPAPTGREVAADLGRRITKFETTKAPEDAGKRMVPNFVISTGDGQMIASVYANDTDGTMAHSIQVYDGIEMSIGSFLAGSEHINEQVYKNWMGTNIYEEVLRSVDQVLTVDKGTLGKDGTKAQETLKDLMPELQRNAKASKAMKETFNEFPSSTDHMAGAKRPHFHEGQTDLTGVSALNFEVLAPIVDRAFRKKAQAYAENQSKPKDVIAKPSKAFTEALSKIWKDVPDFDGVKMLQGKELIALFREDSSFTPEQKKVFWDVLAKDKTFEEHLFYFGEPAQLEAFRDAAYDDLPKQPISLGQTFSAAPVALIANMSEETLLHEMLHAGLMQRFIALNADPSQFSADVRKAHKNLMALGKSFLKLDVTQIPDLSETERQALEALKTQVTDVSTVEGLSEFTSWVMSNKHLIDKARRTKLHSPIVRMLLKGLQTLKTFLGIATPGMDMFSNIVFNAGVLTKSFTPVQLSALTQTNAVFEQTYGVDDKLSQVENLFLRRLDGYIAAASQELYPETVAIEKIARSTKVQALKKDAIEVVEHFNRNRFALNQRQASTFQTIHASLKTAFQIDSAAMKDANQIYQSVMKQITPEHLVENWDSATQDERDTAKIKHAALLDRYNSVAALIALSQVDPSIRHALSQMKLDPETVSTDGTLVDRFIRNLVQKVMSVLQRSFSKPRDWNANLNEQLQDLALALGEIQEDRKFAADRLITDKIQTADSWTSEKLQNLSGEASDRLEAASKKFDKGTKGLNTALKAASVAVGVVNKDKAKAMSDGIEKQLNTARHFDWFQALVRDFRANSDDMKVLGTMLNKVRTLSDRVRQHEKDNRTKQLNNAFSRKLSKGEHKELYMGLGRTDLSSLGRQTVLDILQDPAKAKQLQTQLMDELQTLAPKQYQAYMQKIKSLAKYMVTWEVDTPNLLRNGHAIAHLFNETGAISAETAVDPHVISVISKITSLEAFDLLDKDTKNNLKTLAETEAEAMQLLVGNLAEVHQKEFNRRVPGKEGAISLHNGWKGYIPLNFAQGQEVIIADDRDGAELEAQGYVRVRTYQGDQREDYDGIRGIYQTTVGGKGQFNQGILQTVHTHWHGVDVRYGMTVTSQATQGFVSGAEAKRIQRSQAKTNNGNYMLPIFDDKGGILGYEYSLPIEDVLASAPDFNLPDAVGTWFGRISEEEIATQLNEETVKMVKEKYDTEYSEQTKDEYINIADPELTDEVYKDAWRVLGWQTKKNAAKVFGQKDFFPVKRSEIDVIMGHRKANPKDLWSGVSRLDPQSQKAMRDMLTLFFGDKAYKYIATAHSGLTQFVSWSKLNIVIRSGVVPMMNFGANVLHLAMRGVSPIKQLQAMPRKLREIHRVVEIQEKISELATRLPAVLNDPQKTERIQRRIDALEEEQKSMSIWPVLNNYEFSTISEGLTQADIAMKDGKFFDWLEKQVDRLPPVVSDGAKTVMLAKDTELFKYMHHFMQYGDFVAKSMLYDHLVESKKMSSEDALKTVSSEFVNYNLPAGRWRDALESMGVVWFSNYALRIMPIFINTLREQPVSAMLYMNQIGPMLDLDTVASGSLVGKAWRGTLGYSIGPGMGLRSFGLNPLVNLVW